MTFPVARSVVELSGAVAAVAAARAPAPATPEPLRGIFTHFVDDVLVAIEHPPIRPSP
jgi:hypothetical protein